MDESEWLYARRTRRGRALEKNFGQSGPQSIEQFLALEYPRENARWVLKPWTKKADTRQRRRKRRPSARLR
ncbi:MAG: hypothetical protein WA549_02945 [Thermoplasmata archaeon]